MQGAYAVILPNDAWQRMRSGMTGCAALAMPLDGRRGAAAWAVEDATWAS